jgi:hypothetical protein
MQPESSKAVESRPSTADSVMIDNQSALELNGPKQSFNHQAISAQPSTAAKFTSQSPSKVEATVPVKPKTSQSVVQVDAFEQVKNEIYFFEIYKSFFSLERMNKFLLIYQKVIIHLIHSNEIVRII